MGVVPKESGRVQVNKRGLIEGGVSPNLLGLSANYNKPLTGRRLLMNFFGMMLNLFRNNNRSALARINKSD
jgi:hypothetical protein